jgi:hypothetical protein
MAAARTIRIAAPAVDSLRMDAIWRRVASIRAASPDMGMDRSMLRGEEARHDRAIDLRVGSMDDDGLVEIDACPACGSTLGRQCSVCSMG